MAHTAGTIFIGRGAQFLLPPERGVTVRIIAPPEQRIRQIMKHWEIDRDRARKRMEQTDQSRRDFVHRYFLKDADDPHLYDVVINARHVSVEESVDMIVQLCRRRFD